MALFEYRKYEAVPGKLPALHRRFQTITLGYFKKHGVEVVGFWDVVVGTTNELHYLVRYEDLAHREYRRDENIFRRHAARCGGNDPGQRL